MTNNTLQAHPFSPIINTLGRGKKGSRDLTFDEAKFAMDCILQDKVEPEQLGAFLMLLRVKEETPNEMAGFVSSVRNHLSNLPQTPIDLDWSSYAGKRKQHPWFILAALALASSGVKIFMHGSDGHTPNRVYTQATLNALGLTTATCWQEATEQIEAQNFSFLHLQHINPVLQRLIHLKPIFGLRSPVNTLVRLINPFQAKHSISSIFHPAYGSIQTEAMQLLKQQHFTVFKGDGGEIEARPEANTKCHRIIDGEISEVKWTRLAKEKSTPLESLNITSSVTALQGVWRGSAHDSYGEQAILYTLSICCDLLNPKQTQAQSIEQAQSIWQQRPLSLI